MAEAETQQITTDINSPPESDDTKKDPITCVQDSIDSLSLSLFEALRGLRDAVAPESLMGTSAPGGGGGNTGENALTDPEPDYDDFILSYHKKDESAKILVSKNDGRIPRNKEEYIKLLARTEMQKDKELVTRLSEDVLGKSDEVDRLVASLPGMERTKADQMARIEELLQENRTTEDELREACLEAQKRREEVREALARVTCDALGIEEET